jgi:hypothetical protein
MPIPATGELALVTGLPSSVSVALALETGGKLVNAAGVRLPVMWLGAL